MCCSAKSKILAKKGWGSPGPGDGPSPETLFGGHNDRCQQTNHTATVDRKALTSELPPITDIVRACLKLCGIQPVVDARLLVDLQGSMDENRPSVIGGPTSVLDVLVWLDAQDGKQRISRALRPSTIPQTSLGPRWRIATCLSAIIFQKAESDLTRSSSQRLGGTRKAKSVSCMSSSQFDPKATFIWATSPQATSQPMRA